MADKGTIKKGLIPSNTAKLNNRDAFLGPQLPVSANFDDFEQDDIGFPSQNENKNIDNTDKDKNNEHIKIINGDGNDKQENVVRNDIQQIIKGIIVQEYQRIRQEVHQAANQYLSQKQAKSNYQIEQVNGVEGEMQNSRKDLKRLLNFESYVQGQLEQYQTQKEQMLEQAVNQSIMNQMEKHIVQYVGFKEEIGDFRQQVEQTLREQKQTIEAAFNQYGQKQETILTQMSKDIDLNSQNLGNQTLQIQKKVEQMETTFEKSLEQVYVQTIQKQTQRLENVQKQINQMSNSLSNKVDISRFKLLLDEYFSDTYGSYIKMIQEVKDKCEKLENKENQSEQNAGERLEVIEETNSIKIAGIKEEFSELLKNKENRMNQITDNLNQNRKQLLLLQTQLGKLYAKGGRKMDPADTLEGQDLIQNTASVKTQCKQLIIKSQTVFKALNDVTQVLIQENNQLKSQKVLEQDNKQKSQTKRWKIPASALQLPFQSKSQEQKQMNDSQSSNTLSASHLQEKQDIQIDQKFNNASISQAQFALLQSTGRLKHSPLVIETLRQNEIMAAQLEDLQSKSTDANSKQEDTSSNQLREQIQQQDKSNEGNTQQLTVQQNQPNIQTESNTDQQEKQQEDQFNQQYFRDSFNNTIPATQSYQIHPSFDKGIQILKPINIPLTNQQNLVGQTQPTQYIQSLQQGSINQIGQNIEMPQQRISINNPLQNDQTDYSERLKLENKELVEQREKLLNEQAIIQNNLLSLEVKSRLHSKSADLSEIFYQKETIPPSESVLQPTKQTHPSGQHSQSQIIQNPIIVQQTHKIVQKQQSPHQRLSVSPAVEQHHHTRSQHSPSVSPKQIFKMINNTISSNNKLPQTNQHLISYPLQSTVTYPSQQIPQVLHNPLLIPPLQQQDTPINQHYFNTQPSPQAQQCFDPSQQIQHRQLQRTHSYDPELPSFCNPNHEYPVFEHQLRSPKNLQQDQVKPLFSRIDPQEENNCLHSHINSNPETQSQLYQSAPLLFKSVSPRNSQKDQFVPLFSDNRMNPSNQIVSFPQKRQDIQIVPKQQINIDRIPRFEQRQTENKQENYNIRTDRTNITSAERNKTINQNVNRLTHLLDLSANSKKKDGQTRIDTIKQQYQTSPAIPRQLIQIQKPENNLGQGIIKNRESQITLSQSPQVNSLQIPIVPPKEEITKVQQIQQEKRKLPLTSKEIALEKIIKRNVIYLIGLLFNNKTYGGQAKKLVLKADSNGKYQDIYNKYIFEENGSVLELNPNQIAFLKSSEIAEFI